jgi:rhamnulokinase
MDRLVAIDLGAESGRVIVATLDGGRVALDIVHRFPNGPVERDGGLRWDLPAVFAEIKSGLAEAFKRHRDIASIGVDTWGVDYGLLDAAGELIELPFHYRDQRTEGLPEEVERQIPPTEMFRRTGVRAMRINTLYQLLSHLRRSPERLAKAAHLLNTPDLFHYWLSGEMKSEWSIVGTTQLAQAGKPEWDLDLIRRLGLPERIFRPIVRSGTRLGRLRPELAKELGAANVPWITAPGAHDTSSAVAASPGDPADTAYLSSGTWSLLGVTQPRPEVGEEARRAGLSNEIAADGQVRLNMNIMGLWLVQECRREFTRAGREYSYARLTELAAQVPSSGVVLEVDDARFLPPGQGDDTMPARIKTWLAERGHAAPKDDGALVRLVLDGLVATYRRSLADLERITGRSLAAIHVIGGGSQNRLLNQLAADACGRPVIAGPVEATALGNVLVQALGLGLIPSASAAREMVRASVELETFKPR